MRKGEKLRQSIFWSLDFIKGGKIKKHYDDIKNMIEFPENSMSSKKRSRYLKKIMTHAANSVPLYNNINPSNIQNFPVINKEIIKESYNKFQSYKYKNKKKISVSTSGSTGASFTVFQDLNKKARNTADIVYFSELAGYKLGYKLYYLRFWSMFQGNNKVLNWMQNVIPIDVFNLSPHSIKNLIDQIKNTSGNKSMIGYASIFHKICNYLESVESDSVDCNLKSVIGISERLDPSTKKSVKKYFNVDMVSRYSNAENGMIAQQPKCKEYFDINWASYYVEILSLHNNKQAKPGELGRVVITDLFNYYMPIIRYDTGDVGIMSDLIHNNKTRKVLEKIEGRKMDMIRNTSGEILSTSILLLINNYKEITQRQIIQKTKTEYLFKLIVKNKPFKKEDEFINEFKNYLGQNASITLKFVDNIPLLPSGKQQSIINEVKP
ncbi:CoF synthetase [Flavivirga spongiicola]|uniref:CoF synthetase n=1 Tax=Flavivirga spongiicola TaxID=421621 RepID=A0ABU7XPF3_9FLAO|nr:CoF synthetase [Flavivirga sp. MEBiC05379]MDO5977662.1 CoF synthetase [Flavivirga sp. MEBiC05379]